MTRGGACGGGTGRGRGSQRTLRSASTSGDVGGGPKKGNKKVEGCGTCEKKIGEDSIGCDECELWVHNTEMCSGLTQDMLDAIGRYNGHGIKFVCMACRLAGSSSKNDETHVIEMVGQMFQQLKGICTVVQALAEQVKTLTTQIGDKMQGSESATHSQLPPTSQTQQPPLTYASVTASRTADPVMPSEDYRKIVREELRELDEQRKRKQSLVIRGLGASSANEAVTKFENLSQYLVNQKVSLTDVVRISSETDLYRGKVVDDELRKQLLDKAKQLKTSAQYSTVYIRRDLTYKQRQDLKAKREAATATLPKSAVDGSALPNSEAPNTQPNPDPKPPTAEEGAPPTETIPKQVISPSN